MILSLLLLLLHGTTFEQHALVKRADYVSVSMLGWADGKRVVLWTLDRRLFRWTIQIRNTETGNLEKAYSLPGNWSVGFHGVPTLSPDRTYLLCNGGVDELGLFTLQGKLVRQWKSGNDEWAFGPTWLPDSKHFIVHSVWRRARLFDISQAEPIKTYPVPNLSTWFWMGALDNNEFIAVGHHYTWRQVYSLKHPDRLDLSQIRLPTGYEIIESVLSPDRKQIGWLIMERDVDDLTPIMLHVLTSDVKCTKFETVADFEVEADTYHKGLHWQPSGKALSLVQYSKEVSVLIIPTK